MCRGFFKQDGKAQAAYADLVKLYTEINVAAAQLELTKACLEVVMAAPAAAAAVPVQEDASAEGAPIKEGVAAQQG